MVYLLLSVYKQAECGMPPEQESISKKQHPDSRLSDKQQQSPESKGNHLVEQMITILNHMAEYVLYQDTENTIIWANKSAAASFYSTPEELSGHKCYEIGFHRSEPCTGCPIIKAVATGQLCQSEMQFPNGLILLIQGIPVRDKQGNIYRVIEVAMNITKRKKTEQALSNELARRRILIDQSSDGIVILDHTGKVFEANHRFAEMLGYTHDEILQQHAWEWDTKYTREQITRMIDRLDESGNHLETYHRRKDGSTYCVDISSSASVIEGQRLILCVCRDIDERKRMEQALLDSEAKLKEAHRLAHIGVWDWDSASDTVTWSEELYNITGINPKLPAPTFAEHPGIYTAESFNRLAKAVEDSLKTGKNYELELELARPDGTHRWTYAFGGPKYDNKGNIVGLHGTLQDITERKRMEQEQQYVQRLESTGILAGGIAHDFNNILTAILGSISLARADQHLSEKTDDILKQAEKATVRAKDLTQQLLTFAKGGEPVKKLTSIKEMVEDTASFALRGTNIQCLYYIPQDLWLVNVDKGQISQVFGNLVINARQAMPAGGNIEIIAENMVLSDEQTIGKSLPLSPGDYIRITVIDHGTGISSKYIDKIFDPYFTTKQTGSGLGLTTSYSIIRNHGGHISVESEIDIGSKFYVYLPAVREKIEAKQRHYDRTISSLKGKVLVMDDEDSVRDIAGRMMEQIGFEEIEYAVNGETAIEKYRLAKETGKPFDLIIMDLTVPGGMGGKEALQKLLEIDPGVKAVVSSGYADESVLARYKESGFKSIVAKPYTLEELYNAVKSAM
jgi:PAS domain S-box-containing protein